MGFLSRFEGKMEDTFEGAADKMFDAPISPVQIAKKAEKQMRREKMVGAGKQYAPTLYTVLVNPDDDERLFGYYPTLAGETETYLVAKAAEEGLVMDGHPLVRFIVDEGLRHGKFDVIAEPVAAPIIAQLRQEEMERYGLAAPAAPRPGAGYAPAVAAAPHGAARPQPYGAGAPAADPFAPRASQPAPAAMPAAAPQPYAAPGAPDTYDAYDPYASSGQAEPAGKPPLPYVPEDEIDYSIDYGEYTFDSQDFEDYSQNGPAQGVPIPNGFSGYEADSQGAAPASPAPAPVYIPPIAVPEPTPAYPAAAPVSAPDTVVFAAGAGGANPVPDQAAVRAYLVNTTENRTYALATARLLIGRESKNDIVVHDINASRTHAEIRFEPQGVWSITDLGSTNGTLVNGAEVSSRTLREGDVITIGMTNLMFTQTQGR